MMLSSRIHIRHPTSHEPQPEDILSSALTNLYANDTRNIHGDPSATVIYRSPRFGDVKLTVADPAGEEDRKLFAHYLWNAGVWLGDAVERGSSGSGTGDEGDWGCDVRGQRVLELGAGLGLSGIMSALAGAEKTVISDYPSTSVLKNIRHNISSNFSDSADSSQSPQLYRPTVQPHTWGVLNDPFSTSRAHQFSHILAADCLWMPWEHANLARSMAHFLSLDDLSARIWLVAGFHTGRTKMVGFFDVIGDAGLGVERIEEVDVMGKRREWARDREEDVTARKRWLVVAVLKRVR